MNWRQALLALAALVILRITILPDFWVALGLVTLVWLWNWLHTQFPGMRTLVSWGLGLLVGFAIIGTIGANLYNNYVEPNTPMTRAASSRATIAADMEAAVKINPSMLKSKLATINHLQWMEDRAGVKHAAQLASIRQNFAAGLISQEEALAQSHAIAEEIRRLGAKTQEDLNLLTTNKPASSFSAGSWPVRLVFLGLIMLAILFVPEKIIKVPGKGLIGAIGVILLFTGLTFIMFPEIQPGNLGLDQPTKVAKSPARAPKSSSPKAARAPKAAAPAPDTSAIANWRQRVIPTGITLAIGEGLRITKESAATPAIPIILRLSDGEEHEFPASNWGSRYATYLHAHPDMRGLSATVFYEGEAGKYHFEKLSASRVREIKANLKEGPDYVRDPSRSATPAKAGPSYAAAPKANAAEDCPFD